MKRTEKQFLAIVFVSFIIWISSNYLHLQERLNTPMTLPTKLPLYLPVPSQELSDFTKPSETLYGQLSDESHWDIIKPLDPVSQKMTQIIFTPMIQNKPAKICVGLSCYDFIGLVGNKVIFNDLNLSASKKILSFSKGQTITKPIRVDTISKNRVTLIDTKSKTKYDIPIFKIDLDPYKPKSSESKGKK